MAFEGIGQVKNPIVRTALSAWIAFTAAEMIGGVVAGFKVEKSDKHFTTVGYVSLIAAVIGGLYGLIRTDPTPAPGTTRRAKEGSDDPEWSDWRNMVVFRKVQESTEITSFYLRPQDKGMLPSFKPGQFLTIQLDIPGQPRPVIRTYSLSDHSPNHDYYRLSIKREPAPKGQDVPPGIASHFMHNHVKEGTVIPAKPPNGKFVLDVAQNLPVLLISNGVGITPMIAMVKACCQQNPQRHVWFLHGARNGEFHAFRNEIGAIAHEFPNLHVYYRYSRPRPEDEGQYHNSGYIDAEMIKTIIAPEIEKAYGTTEKAEYFLCGSPSFMDSLRDGLREWGVPDGQVFFESFSKPKATPKAVMAEAIAGTNDISSAEVTFAKSGKTATWTPDQGTLLEFAEAQGLDPAYSCRDGICLTCMCAIEEGEVHYEEPPTGTPDEGTVLICISQPKTEQVVLSL